MSVYEYAEKFTQLLQQKYAKELCSDDLTQSNPQVTFINAHYYRYKGTRCYRT